MSEKNEPKFHRDKEGKINQIVDTFLKMLNQMEYNDISTNKIAKEAGISIGTIYNYFRNKEEILQYIFGTMTEDFIELDDVMKILLDRDLVSTKEFISNYLKNHKEYYVLNKAHDQAMVLNQNVFLQFQENIKNYIKYYYKFAQEKNYDLGDITEEKLAKVFGLVLNIIDTQVHHHLFREPIFDSDKELVDYLAKMFQFTLDFYL